MSRKQGTDAERVPDSDRGSQTDMQRERPVPIERAANLPDAADESPTAKVRRLRTVPPPYAWDPYEVWRTRVKPKEPGEPGE